MLLELSSDSFKSHGKKREKIVFKKGLNLVVGDSNKSNSIGKSTFLMIIDFCFGGRDYVDKGKDIISNIGHHAIKFAFQFGDSIYYFSRTTDDLKMVNTCNENYEILENKGLDIKDFTNFLKEKYSLEISISFRETVSKYFRVYGRDVTKESKPLAVGNEAEDKSVKRLIKLYGHDFSQLEKKVKMEGKKKENFQSLIVTGVQEKVGKRDFNSNNKLIQQKKKEVLEITTNFIGTQEAEQIAFLKSELSQLERQKNKVELEKNDDIENNAQLFFDVKEIEEFFPNVNIKKISEIEVFHRNITGILKKEIKEEIEKKQIVIDDIDNQINQIENELSNFSSLKDISRRQLAFVQEAQKIVDTLENKNKIYSQGENLRASSEEAINELNHIIEKTIAKVSDSINQGLKKYNSTIFHSENRIPPQISFRLNKAKKWMYDFKTEDDTGTGTAFKSLILFDLVMLSQTVLPAVAHDSFLFTDIENSTTCEIIKLYNQFQKQIFVALTDENSYGNKEVMGIIKEREVLYLSAEGNELFGKSWKIR